MELTRREFIKKLLKGAGAVCATAVVGTAIKTGADTARHTEEYAKFGTTLPGQMYYNLGYTYTPSAVLSVQGQDGKVTEIGEITNIRST